MILILVATLLVLAIAFYQVIQGLFSALIMAFLTVVSAVVAFQFYEPLASAAFYNKFSAYADGTCLAGLFLATLLALRLGFDSLIHGNVVVGPWFDRLGGGVLGLLTGTIIIGVVLVALQMLPFGETVLTFRPYDAALQRDQSASPLCPDEFVVSLTKTLSAGSLSGSRSYAQQHGTLLLDEFCARNTAGKHGRTDAPPDSVKDVTVYVEKDLPPNLSNIPLNPLLDKTAQDHFYILRVKVSADAADTDNWFRLPATHFRLITNQGRSCYPVAYLTGSQVDTTGKELAKAWKVYPAATGTGKDDRAQVGNLIVERPSAKEHTDCVVDWVYRVPAEEAPQYLVFRRASIIDLGGRIANHGLPPMEGSLSTKVDAKRPN